MTGVLAVAVAGYLGGAIPFSYIAGRLVGGIDLREHGSGNLGASNTFRFLGPRIAGLVLLLDVAKGFLPVYFAPAWGGELFSSGALMVLAGFMAVMGHMFSVFVRFRGGKGIATTAGVFLALAPLALLAAFVVWGIVFATTRIVSVASLAGALALPLGVYAWSRLGTASYDAPVLVLSGAIAGVVVVKHRSNIRRLLAGEEPALRRHKERT